MATKKRLLTGDRPSGPLHLGHWFGSIKNRVALQDEYDCYFIIADYEYLTDHIYDTDNFNSNISNLVLDYLSLGIDPSKSTIFVESEIPEISELNLIFSMMVKLPRIQRNPTIKEEIKQKGISDISFGYIGWPIIQAADILSMKGEVVPVGEDQLPHVEQTREIARTFNSNIKDIFKVPEAIVEKGLSARLPGLDGKKMSKSLGNAIFFTDSSEEVEKKIMSAITDPKKIKKDDPGNPEICNIYKYYKLFDPEYNLKEPCQKGKIGCVECKKRMAGLINDFLDPIRERRLKINKSQVKEILENGRVKASKEAKETLNKVKDSMKINYKF